MSPTPDPRADQVEPSHFAVRFAGTLAVVQPPMIGLAPAVTQAIVDVGEYSREPDRIKRAGKAFDSDRDQGHFLDLNDDGTVLGTQLEEVIE